MRFLRPLISRVITDEEIVGELATLESDKTILNALEQFVSFDKIRREFKSYYGVDFIDLRDVFISAEILTSFDIDTLKNNNILPYRYKSDSETYYFAINDFLNNNLRKSIVQSSEAMGKRARFSYSPSDMIQEKYKLIEQELKEDEKDSEPKTKKKKKVSVIESPDGEFSAQLWLDGILNEGIDKGASDIHIERLEEVLQVRYRIDGQVTNITKYAYSESEIASIFVRLKVIGGMNISERRKPQDGRVNNYEYNEQLYDMRVSTVATIHGEKAVLRIINKSEAAPSYENLGFSQEDASKVRRILSNHNGLLYIAGATGSGKTTTLYSMIDELNQDSVNIYTIEDPVEKTIENINQIQIEPAAGVTFPSTLKALLRQDPDVIVVGEIRDKETAELSVQSSLTGHLVLSTIHANTALDSITRLLNMGVEPYMVAGSSLGFLSQRLVRNVCPHCKVPHGPLSSVEQSWVDNIEDEHNVKIDTDNLYKANGCDKCIGGYRGRIAVIEIIEVSPKIRELILNEASLAEINEQAKKEGFTPMVINGLEKASAGLTTLEEVISEII